MARRFTKDCHELGIIIHGTFILGLPGETKETIQETIRYATEINPHTIQVSLAAPYPGTFLHRQALENLAGKLLEQETVDGSAADEALAAEAATAGVELAAQPGSAGDAGRTVAGVQIPMEGQVIAEAPDLDAGGAPG